MVERVNNRISDGIFHASTGGYALSLLKFIDLMSLGHSTATWGNKLTMYFRLKTLYSYSQHVGGANFQSPAHNEAWDIVSNWVINQNALLPENWITTRFGNTQLRTLLRGMVQAAFQSKFYTLPIRFLVCLESELVLCKAALSTWMSLSNSTEIPCAHRPMILQKKKNKLRVGDLL